MIRVPYGITLFNPETLNSYCSSIAMGAEDQRKCA
jgi:hypothetical protein